MIKKDSLNKQDEIFESQNFWKKIKEMFYLFNYAGLMNLIPVVMLWIIAYFSIYEINNQINFYQKSINKIVETEKTDYWIEETRYLCENLLGIPICSTEKTLKQKWNISFNSNFNNAFWNKLISWTDIMSENEIKKIIEKLEWILKNNVSNTNITLTGEVLPIQDSSNQEEIKAYNTADYIANKLVELSPDIKSDMISVVWSLKQLSYEELNMIFQISDRISVYWGSIDEIIVKLSSEEINKILTPEEHDFLEKIYLGNLKINIDYYWSIDPNNPDFVYKLNNFKSTILIIFFALIVSSAYTFWSIIVWNNRIKKRYWELSIKSKYQDLNKSEYKELETLGKIIKWDISALYLSILQIWTKIELLWQNFEKVNEIWIHTNSWKEFSNIELMEAICNVSIENNIMISNKWFKIKYSYIDFVEKMYESYS